MNGWQSFLMVFCGLGLVHSFFLGTTLVLKDRFHFNSLFYLGIMLFGLALRLAKSYFIFVPPPYPHWGIVAGGAGLWMIGPAFYLYALHSINTQRKSSVLYLIHFVPMIIILITGTTDYVYYVGLAQLAIYFSLSLSVAMKAGVENLPKHFKVFAFSIGLILLCFIGQALRKGIEVYTLGLGIAVSILYIINYFILVDADFFQPIRKKSKSIDGQRAEKIARDLNQVFTEEKLYRNSGLTIAMVAQQIDCPAYLISQVIYQGQRIRFNEFVNRFRVQEAKERLQRDNDKIDVIAREVGFSSTSSLYDAFKKETQRTPQAYRNEFTRPEIKRITQ
jgi:AraC-like DNA-binding protein